MGICIKFLLAMRTTVGDYTRRAQTVFGTVIVRWEFNGTKDDDDDKDYRCKSSVICAGSVFCFELVEQKTYMIKCYFINFTLLRRLLRKAYTRNFNSEYKYDFLLLSVWQTKWCVRVSFLSVNLSDDLFHRTLPRLDPSEKSLGASIAWSHISHMNKRWETTPNPVSGICAETSDDWSRATHFYPCRVFCAPMSWEWARYERWGV